MKPHRPTPAARTALWALLAFLLTLGAAALAGVGQIALWLL